MRSEILRGALGGQVRTVTRQYSRGDGKWVKRTDRWARCWRLQPCATRPWDAGLVCRGRALGVQDGLGCRSEALAVEGLVWCRGNR